MLQTEDNLLHRQPPFANHPRGVKQPKAAHQAYDQMAVVRLLALPLAGSRRQSGLQGPKTGLDPVAPLPCPDAPRPADGGVETHHVALLLPRLTHHDDRYRAIRWTGGLQPR